MNGSFISNTIDMKWSRNVLLNQIKANTYHRQAIATKYHNFKETLPAHIAEEADEAIKDSYMLDFLGIREPILERNLEQKMVTQIQSLLINRDAAQQAYAKISQNSLFDFIK